MLNQEIIKAVPKVELHEHLDGGLRPETIIDIAIKNNVSLPSYEKDKLASWFHLGCDRKSLSLYLETFAVTTSVMQDKESLIRISREEIEDLAKENVVYAEIRFCPALHTKNGLSEEQVVTFVLEGLELGRQKTGVEYGLILSAMRHESQKESLRIAELAVAFSERGVVGFDLAGDEFGNPPKKHIEAFQYIKNKNFNITVHAGEAFGLESIWQALQLCSAHRIGHATKLTDDIVYDENGSIIRMGSLAQFIQDKRIPLEMCLTSNVGTGAVLSYKEHPYPMLHKNNFRVFLSSDNRLMSDTSLSHEMEIAVKEYGFNLNDLEKMTINAMKSAFVHHHKKLKLICKIKDQYKMIRQKYHINESQK